MKAIQFDSVGGASGDMVLASLVALGADMAAIEKGLAPMGLGPFEIIVDKVHDSGFLGTRVRVFADAEEHGHAHAGEHHHHHRRLSDIEAMIAASSFEAPVKDLAVKVFRRLAEAEGAVHGVSPSQVHFHEVGAVDSIIDIVGACAALLQLGIGAVKVGPLPLSTGTIKGAHGVMPLPAPATVALLRGHPMVETGETVELVTPTGAALLSAWAEALPFPGGAQFSVVSEGNAFGARKLARRPNLLRALMLESGESSSDHCLVLECNLDDAVPELIGSLSQKLMDSGALDVFSTAIQMKKQRPGTLLTVLCAPADRGKCLDLIFRESTTFGVREHLTSRTVLERRHVTVATPYGDVRVKVGRWKGDDITRSPEHEDCAKLAREKNVPVRTVYEAAQRAG